MEKRKHLSSTASASMKEQYLVQVDEDIRAWTFLLSESKRELTRANKSISECETKLKNAQEKRKEILALK